MSFPIGKRKVDSWKSLGSKEVEDMDMVSKNPKDKLLFNIIVQKHATHKGIFPKSCCHYVTFLFQNLLHALLPSTE